MYDTALRPVSRLAIVALACAPLAMVGVIDAASRPAAAPQIIAYEIRSLYTNEFGVDRPNGVSWDREDRALVVTGPAPGGGSEVLRVTGETLVGSSVARGLKSAKGASLDPRSGRLVAPGRAGAVASTHAPDGTQYVLDDAGAIAAVSSGGQVRTTRVSGLSGTELGAIAHNPEDRMLYVASADGTSVHALGSTGDVVRSYDVSSVGIDSLEGMAFAPSSDATDDPAEQSLFVADSGDSSTLGRVAEVSLAPAAVAAAPNVNATLVATVDTSLWSPPAPDTSGIAYMPGADRFVVADSEVDEMPIYAGANLFTAQRSGALTGTGATLTWSNEPTGVGFNPTNGHLFVSDDDKKSIFEIASPGADGRFGTADDGARTTFKTSTFGNTDPEDVGYDSLRGELLLIDGVGRDMFRLNPGPNGVFNGVAPGGDDIATAFDVEQFGAIDPEGITYDAARDTVVVVDGSSERIYEFDTNGSLIGTIDITAANSDKAAGITIAPASNGSGARRYYVVDRGLDNNSHPSENDGRIYELAATPAPITNRPPAANAGPDQLIDLPETTTLTGSAVDDGVPTPVLTYSWSKLSGPGNVAFGSANAATTTATFSLVGSYVVRLVVSDGQLEDFDDLVVTVHQPGAPRTVQIPIASGADDAMEGGGSTGKFVDLASADIELGHNGGTPNVQMLNGLRFQGLPIPPNGEIVSARIQFKVDETGNEAAAYNIRGEANDNPPTYVSVAGNISSRPAGTASVPWSPPAWNTIGDTGPAQLTPDLKTIVQEAVNRPGWVEGNAVAFMIDGTGRRTAEAKDGLSPPVLVLEFRRQAPNAAPVVNAGLDAAIQLPATAALDGTVTDDAQPQALPTTTWTKVSGPGTVTFGDPALVDTTAAFSLPGSYTLRLTANDGALTTFDEVVVAVEQAGAAPVVNAGPDRAVQLPAGVSLDGTLVDPGYPGAVTTAWSKVSGPGTVTFGDAAALDTTASFSVAGSYTLRLSGTNAETTGQDSMLVAVEQADAPPVVSAGPDRAIQLPSGASLDGTLVSPGHPGPLTTAWSKVSGPGTVTFQSASSVDTTAAFSAAGTYTLQLSATNATGTAQDTMDVVVERAYAAPVVNAGPDRAVQLPAGITLDGTLVDPGYSGPVTTTWSKASGPGTVTFGNASAIDTTASFSAAGSYTLRLSASNANRTGQDTMVVVVEQANAAPVVSAGPDRTVRIPLPAVLNGNLVSPGYPGPAVLQWTKTSGPGNVTFDNPNVTDTTATFSTAGTYTLRLTATNNLFSSFDEMVVVAQKPLLSLSFGADSAKVSASEEVGLAGKVTRVADGQPVVDEEVAIWVTRSLDGSRTLLAKVHTGSNGEFGTADQPVVSSRYVAASNGDSSPEAAVAVAPRVTARLSPYRIVTGQIGRMSGVVSPSAAGQPVQLQRWNGTSWFVVRSKTLPAGSRVAYSFNVRHSVTGRYHYRTFVPAFAGRTDGVSPKARVTVYRADIVRVGPTRDVLTVRNTGTTPFNLSGWVMRNRTTGLRRVLPSFVVQPGLVVRIHSGSGVNDANDLFLRRDPMWPRHGEAVLRNNRRALVDRFRY